MGEAERVIEIPYAPRKLQAAVHEALDQARFVVVVAHRRFGKTVLAINDLIRAAVECDRPRPRMAYIGPTYRQAKAVVWDYLKHYAQPIPGIQFNESELRADLPNGGQVRLYGADNPDALRGLYLDRVVLDETGLMQTRVWTEVVRPALSDRVGKALFIGTPNGQNLFWSLRNQAAASDGWRLFEFRASQTGILALDELNDAKRTMSEDAYQQEYECSFEAAVRGSIYGRVMQVLREQNRLTRVPYDPLLAVHTAWDLGIGDSMAIWCAQRERSGDVRVIDYYENSGEGLGHYVNWLNARGYTFERHYLPHDANVRELGTGKSRLEMLRSLGLQPEALPLLPLEDGIEATRMFLRRCWIDAERCRDGIDALVSYRRRQNTRTEEFGSPEHDWASHGADAMRYLATGLRAHPDALRMKPINYSNAGIV